MRTVGDYAVVQTDAEAIARGYQNVATWRMAVRKELAAMDEKARAEFEAQHQARLAKKLQTPPNPTSFYVGVKPKAA
jgi:hypothetical protein